VRPFFLWPTIRPWADFLRGGGFLFTVVIGPSSLSAIRKKRSTNVQQIKRKMRISTSFLIGDQFEIQRKPSNYRLFGIQP
jgi:hypothetical protein